MAQAITLAGEKLFAKQAQLNKELNIDTFIFAHVPELDPSLEIDRSKGLPSLEQRVHTQIIQQKGRINENVVVYSTVLDSLTGPFEFNWVGLYSSVHETLVAVQHIPLVSKTITEGGAAGNTLNRNFGIEYSGIAGLTNITVDAQTWQLDFTARLAGIDKLHRQLANEMNGENWFSGDNFKVTNYLSDTFKVEPGFGYVYGLRVELNNTLFLTVDSYPKSVYIDAWVDGDASGVWAPKHEVILTNETRDNYKDQNGKEHFLLKIAEIESANVVQDLRNTNGLKETINEHLSSQKAHEANSIQLENGTSIEEEVNRNASCFNIPEKKPQRFSTEEVLSYVQTSGESTVKVKSGASLSFVELIAPLSEFSNLEAFFEFDYIYGELDEDFQFFCTTMNDLNRESANSIDNVSVVRYHHNLFRVTASSSISPQNFAAWSVRALPNKSCELNLKKVYILDNGNLIGMTDFSLLGKREEWTNSLSEIYSDSIKQRVSIPTNQGQTLNCDYCEIAPQGSFELGKKPYNILYFIETLQNQSQVTKNAKLQAGIYKPTQNRYYLQPTNDINLISVGGKSTIMCGSEIKSNTWISHQSGPGVFVKKAPYVATNHWNPNVRNNSIQPKLAALVSPERERSVKNYYFTPVNSLNEVESAPGRSFHDGENIYFSFSSINGFEDSCYVYVCESEIGIRLTNPDVPINLKAFNIEVLGAEIYNWRFRPNNLSDKFISLHWCGSIACATKEGFSLDRIDSELINCYGNSNYLDDFNFHDGGYSLILNPYSKSSGDDGISHHEECEGWVENAIIKYPAAAFSATAFGAKVFHKNCIGYATKSGTTSGKNYEQSFASISGQGSDSHAYFESCITIDSDNDYSAISQESGRIANLSVNKGINKGGTLGINKSNIDVFVQVKN